MNASIALVTLLVREYDEAIAFFTGALGFELREDRPQGDAKRWVVVGPAGGRGAFFLETEDFARDHARLLAAGVHFTEAPRYEPYGTVAVFSDPYGNKWDLLERRAAT